jgi:hypothetical protein
MPFCSKCGADAGNANFCPKCGASILATASTSEKKKGMGCFTGGCLVSVIAVVGIMVLGALTHDSQKTDSTDSNTSATATVSDDAALLISRCGQPSNDDSTAYDDPRPPIPSRIIEFGKHGLRFMFIPTGKLGDPPPYRWKLIGITDMAARDPSKARVVQPDEAVRRMPCWSK